jgi:hypothetical protein
VRKKEGIEIPKKKKKMNAEIMATFVGICHVWIRRRVIHSAAEHIDYRDLFTTWTEIGSASCLTQSGLQNSLAWKSETSDSDEVRSTSECSTRLIAT